MLRQRRLTSFATLLFRRILAFPAMRTALRAHSPVEMQSLKDSSARPWSRCWEKWARLPRPWTRPSAPLFGHLLLLKPKQREQLTSCTSVPNCYSQYFSTQYPIVYYTLFTASTLAVKSVFWHTHAIHVFLNTPPFTDLLTRPSNRYPRHQSMP